MTFFFLGFRLFLFYCNLVKSSRADVHKEVLFFQFTSSCTSCLHSCHKGSWLFFTTEPSPHESDSVRPMHYSASDRRVARTPSPSPCPHSSLRHTFTHRFIGSILNRLLSHVSSVRPTHYSVPDNRVSSSPSPLPSHLDTTFPYST